MAGGKAALLGLRPLARAQDSRWLPVRSVFAYVRDTLLWDSRFGASRFDRSRLLFEGGLTLRTSLDLVAQANAQAAANGVTPGQSGRRCGRRRAPGTGNVLAMAVNRRYGLPTDGKPVDKTTDFVHTKLSMPTDPIRSHPA